MGWVIQEKSNAEEQFYEIYRDIIKKEKLLYLPMKQEEFMEFFFAPQEGIKKLVVQDKAGFAAGCYDEKSKKAFITFVGVKKEKRRQGNGKAVLVQLEKKLEDISGRKCFEISFFNPMSLAWAIPGKSSIMHPNAPGVDITSSGYFFFKNCGYGIYAVQNSYYLQLSDYETSARIAKSRQELQKKGFSFAIYERQKHKGMEEMIRKLGNPMWESAVLGEPGIEENGNPIMIPVYQDRVCGFTGPFLVEPEGRGAFAGIAIDEAYRGNGIAKVLFAVLCQELKKMGAEYMTLFTGENNPARHIYEEAGFEIVRTWADMRKESGCMERCV